MKLHPHSTLRSRLEGFLSENPIEVHQDDYERGYERGVNRAIDELENTSPYRPWQILGGACLSVAVAFLLGGRFSGAIVLAVIGGLMLLGEHSSNSPKVRR